MDELNKYISEWQLQDVPQTELPQIGWENMYNQEQDQVDVVQSGCSVHNHENQGPMQHDGWNTVPSQDNRQSEADQVAHVEVSSLKDVWG